MHEAAATCEDAVYNLARSLKTLRIDLTDPLNGKPGRRSGQSHLIFHPH